MLSPVGRESMSNPFQAQESRRQTREQRIREREAAKILEEENLRKLQEEEEKLASGEARRSERYLREQMRKAQRQLKKLKEKTEWTFDCEKCGLSGANLVSSQDASSRGLSLIRFVLPE